MTTESERPRPDAGAPPIPYVNYILEGLARGDEAMGTVFGRHIHWGYWDDPATADASFADVGAAAERMGLRVCDAAAIGDGDRVLDCGCGVGGVLASLNERLSNVDLVGINIDPRQLDVARTQVEPRPGNAVDFQEADACDLPFPDESFDVVLAVEAIFHFPSRLRFLREARRVLRPGGRVVISDFVPRGPALPLLLPFSSFTFYGRRNQVPATMASYRAMARLAGLTPRLHEDVTRNTLPTYDVVLRFNETFSSKALREGRRLARISRLGLLRYKILGFDRR